MIGLKRKAASSIEIILIMILLILFSGAIFTLIYAGAITQENITNEKEMKVNIRVASSYINVKLRKYDEEGSILIKKNPFTNKDTLVFRDPPDPNYTNEELFTWIFLEDGILYSQTITKDEELYSGLGVEIARISGLEVLNDGNRITTIIEYVNNGEIEKLESVYVVRSLD